MKKTKKISAVSPVRVNVYNIINMAVEEGVNYGYRRAFKHTDKPDEFLVKDAIITAVMSELCEYLQFDDPES